MQPFALLDDCRSDGAVSRLYTGWCGERISHSAEDLPACWQAVQIEMARGRHVVLLADFEWGVRLQGVALPRQHPPGCLRFLIFESLQRLEASAVDCWLAAQVSPDHAPAALVGAWQPEMPAEAFEARVRRIHALIRDGETYQVNLTLRLHNRLLGDPLAFYRMLRERQPVPYGALIHRPQSPERDAGSPWLLSLSPELFVRHEIDAQDARLIARPMKGTVARVPDDAQRDQAAADWLAADPKNRAENLMITDLLRNDLGRIARTGSVKVPALFAVEAHGALWQMTSTVQAEPLPQLDLPALLQALFPCGSITGAPKRHTLELIGTLEDSHRGLYTGAIGWIDPAPAGSALGPLALSVAIRTLELTSVEATAVDGASQVHEVRLGVGCGIVLDSDPTLEWQECLLKARFATEGVAP